MYTTTIVPNDPLLPNNNTDPLRLAGAYEAFEIFRNATIETSNLQNGMIICELWSENQCVAKEKIIIIH